MQVLMTVNAAWNIRNFRLPLVAALRADGHRVTVLAPPDDSVPELEAAGCRFLPLEMDVRGLNPLRDLALLRRFRAIFAAERPDVVLGFTIKNNLFGAMAARRLGIPFLPNVTGLGTAFLSGGALRHLAQGLYRHAFRGLPAVLFQNAEDRDLFLARRLVAPGQAVLVPGSGIDLAQFAPAPWPQRRAGETAGSGRDPGPAMPVRSGTAASAWDGAARGEAGRDEIGTDWVRPGEAGPGEVDPGETGKGAAGPGQPVGAALECAAGSLGAGEGPVFLMIARLLRDKGVVEYVEAARLLRHSHPAARFRLIGAAGSDNRTAIGAAEAGRWRDAGLVDWPGPVADVRPHIAAADCVVLPSYREGAPRVLIEAGALARPVIATDVPGCREVVAEGETGLLCAPRDAASLAAACARFAALPVPSRIAMGRAGRARIEARYDVAHVARIYRELIRRAVAGSAPTLGDSMREMPG